MSTIAKTKVAEIFIALLTCLSLSCDGGPEGDGEYAVSGDGGPEGDGEYAVSGDGGPEGDGESPSYCSETLTDMTKYVDEFTNTYTGMFVGTVERLSVEDTFTQVTQVACERVQEAFTMKIDALDVLCTSEAGNKEEGYVADCEAADSARFDLDGTLDVGDGITRAIVGHVMITYCEDGFLLKDIEISLDHESADRESLSCPSGKSKVKPGHEVPVDTCRWSIPRSEAERGDETPAVVESCALRVMEHEGPLR